MTLLFCDGFDHYTNANIAQKGWNTTNNGGANVTFGMGTGRFGGQSMFTTSGNGGGGGYWRAFSSNYATMFVGMAYTVGNLDSMVFTFRDSTTDQIDVRHNALGQLRITRNGTILATSAAQWIYTNTWVYIEIGVHFSSTAGWVEVKASGNLAISYYGSGTNRATANGNTISSANAFANRVDLGCIVANPTINNGLTYDDLYIFDSSGAVNNDFAGEVRVQTIYPSAAGANTQWTPSSGANYTDVNEAQDNGDTSYVSTTTTSNVDSYAFGDLSTTVSSIKAVQVTITARSDDAGNHTIQAVQKNGASQSNGATSAAIGGTYQAVMLPKDTSIITGSAWDVAELNASEFGVELIS